MKPYLKKLIIILCVSWLFLKNNTAQAQCAAGYTSDTINWDMQYYSGNYLPNPDGRNTVFAIGKNSMRLSWSGTNTFRGPVLTASGPVNVHTGETNTFGRGNDLRFIVGNGADTLTFDQEVMNLKFSVSDIDISHRMYVTATNAAGTAINITTLARASGTTLTITGSGTTSALASASSTAVANTATNSVANVTIAGPVKQVVLRFTKASGTDSIFISDISACVQNSDWAIGYQLVATPEIGQPSYVLAAYGPDINVVDLTNNTSTVLYTDPILAGVNSLAYDGYRQVIYFTDNTRVDTNRSIYQYDVKTGVRSVFVNDVRDYGMQLVANYGLGSAGASFYDGYLFIGNESSNVQGNPISIWRFEINPDGSAGKAARVWSKMGFGVNYKYDWSDFVINDGILYNFNNATGADALTSIEHIDLDKQRTIVGYTSAAASQAQTSIDYQGNIYNMQTGGFQLYNGAGTYGATTAYTGYTGSILDASEAFKYPYDFGDAPDTYNKAYHLFDKDQRLKIGNALDFEISGSENINADADDNYDTGSSNDEDGVAFFPELTVANASYSVDVAVTNTTGADATLYAFLDFDINGKFNDPGERSLPVTVADGETMVTVTWIGLSGGTVGQSYIRFRLASDSAEASNIGGFASNGEVEDYPINIEVSLLPVELISFTARAEADKGVAVLNWQTASEFNNNYFEVQRSADAVNWTVIGSVQGAGFSSQLRSYEHKDMQPVNGLNYYRLRQVDFDGRFEFSTIEAVKFSGVSTQQQEVKKEFQLFPNPSAGELWIKSKTAINPEQPVRLEVYDVKSSVVFSASMDADLYRLDLSAYETGMYLVRIENETYKILRN
jgi:hypothetical protein